MSVFVIGVTGGVASGKSTVTLRFERLGITIADADVAAREVVAPGSEGLADVLRVFGPGVMAADGSLDRTAMRAHVFADPAARKQLEAIVHPRVRARVKAICTEASGPYAIASIPLLAEGGGRDAYPWLARILVVDVPMELQLSRLMQRDGVDEPLARSMIAAQASRAQRLAIADDILVNDGSLDALDAHVAALDRQYRALAAAAAVNAPPAS